MDRSGINHSHSHATNATMFRSTDPAAQITSVGDDSLRVGKNFARLFSQKLTPALSFKQGETQPTLEFGQPLRESGGGHAER